MRRPQPLKTNYYAKKRAAQFSAELEEKFPSIRLAVELVPAPCWGRNLRSRVQPNTWDLIRSYTLQRAKGKCQICEAKISRAENAWEFRAECHEIWRYEDLTLKQVLSDVLALCSLCHEVKHIGLAGMNDRLTIAKKRLCKLNNWSNEIMEEYLAICWKIWRYRSRNHWTRDLNWVVEKGFPYKPRKPTARAKGV
jgi:hypothetical protein